MPRGPRLDAPGCLHHVIVRGIERRPLFRDDADREDLVARLAVMVERTATGVLAWALLPNHFHLLLRTASAPLSDVMRVLNTGYAVRFNRRQRRTGYLFQNRFKSLLVDEERYLLELVRYIHLNPLRAHLVSTLEDLAGFPWTGHAALLGRTKRPWQAVTAVLQLFGSGARAARAAYRQFVADGIAAGSGGALVGGGLRRQRGGWVQRTERIRGRDRWAFDERILGSGGFVERVLAEHAAAARPPVVNATDIPALLSTLLQRAAAQCAVAPDAITSSSHRAAPARGRALFCRWAVVDLGVSSKVVARFLGVTRQSVRRALERCDHVFGEIECSPE
jgi:putative transposase